MQNISGIHAATWWQKLAAVGSLLKTLNGRAHVIPIEGYSAIPLRYNREGYPVYPLMWRHDIQHNDTQHNDIQHNNKKIATLSIKTLVIMALLFC